MPQTSADHVAPLARPSLVDLDDVARRTFAEIVQQEQATAVLYWQLGRTLSEIRRKFQHGQWLLHLKHLGIDPPRASKASAIFRTFSNTDALVGMSVEEAYGRRQRKRGGRRRSTDRRRLVARSEGDADGGIECDLADLDHVVRSWLSEADRLPIDRTTTLLDTVRLVASLLGELEDALAARVRQASSSDGANARSSA